MVEMQRREREERFVGTLLGTGVEGMSREAIRRRFGEVRDFLPQRGRGCTTDDTQMTLALTQSIVRSGGVDGADCARAYAEHFDAGRGYGRSAAAVLEALRRGADYRKTGTMLFAEGSFGNGAAMRIAPLGLLCGIDDGQGLRDQVYAAARCTHVHPEAIDGAVVQAAAAALLAFCRTDALRRKLDVVAALLRSRADDEEAAKASAPE